MRPSNLQWKVPILSASDRARDNPGRTALRGPCRCKMSKRPLSTTLVHCQGRSLPTVNVTLVPWSGIRTTLPNLTTFLSPEVLTSPHPAGMIFTWWPSFWSSNEVWKMSSALPE